jgi:pyrimidine operon attenuation protein/uracil phosphoribosyltransferase
MAGIRGYEGRYAPVGDQALADRPTQVRLTVEIDEVVRSLPNRAEWLRRVITEAAQRELLSSGTE